jgi:hypothetical protein
MISLMQRCVRLIALNKSLGFILTPRVFEKGRFIMRIQFAIFALVMCATISGANAFAAPSTVSASAAGSTHLQPASCSSGFALSNGPGVGVFTCTSGYIACPIGWRLIPSNPPVGGTGITAGPGEVNTGYDSKKGVLMYRCGPPLKGIQ